MNKISNHNFLVPLQVKAWLPKKLDFNLSKYYNSLKFINNKRLLKIPPPYIQVWKSMKLFASPNNGAKEIMANTCLSKYSSVIPCPEQETKAMSNMVTAKATAAAIALAITYLILLLIIFLLAACYQDG